MLINAGANPNLKDQKGKPPVAYAFSSPKTLQRLLAFGDVDLSVVDDRGYTLLMMALEENWRHNLNRLVQMLLKHGVDPNVRAKDGKTAHDLCKDAATAQLLKTP